MLSDYKAVFFDAGGTLFHPHPSVGEIYASTAAKYGCAAAPEELERLFKEAWLHRDGLSSLISHNSEKIEREWWKNLVRDVFKRVGGVREFEEFFDELYTVFGHPEAWKLYPGTREVLTELKKRGKKLAVISNWDSRLFHLCEAFGLNELFDFVIASAVFGASKPNPKIFEGAMRQMQVEPHEAAHVGDSYEDDVRGARNAGLHGILIDRGARPRKFEGIITIRSLEELL